MIRSLLIANRGEIARRIIRTARAMGIRTVAVHSDVDAKLPFVPEADVAVCIGPAPARESYLRGDRIIEVALETKAEAIHPGYGFLSENAEFADAVIAAGLVWVGAPPAAIRAMGLKDAAKALMQAAGVPVTPGYLGADQLPARLKAEAEAIGWPVLIKAVAGGGGKGMRRVDDAAAFDDALESCRREAASSFGDDRVLLEKYILNPRHIEVQVFGDTFGQVVHLFERDCSLQRRHQKVIEEAPAPGMDEATRAALCATAVRAAAAVDYVGAGTIEFIADASDGLRADRIWFMEMNTRLQVEHPVTEAITGQDLVEWQLRVASGEPLPKRQEDLAIEGWAMEARLYAENPATGFLPSTGRLEQFRVPDWGGRIRVDSAVEEGSDISPFYDPMIAKLIAHGVDRDQAAATLARACDAVVTWPVRNNAGFLAALLRHHTVLAGAIDTGFIAANLNHLNAGQTASDQVRQTAASLLFRQAGGSLGAIDPTDFPYKPGQIWRDVIGFRLNQEPDQGAWISDGMEDFRVTIGTVTDANASAGSIIRGTEGDGIVVVDQGWAHFFELPGAGRRQSSSAGGDGAILSPMPGRIVSVEVAEGDAVVAGQKLVAIEAMKMEQALVAPFDGVVAEVKAVAGAQVSEGTLLARVERAS